jgi:cytosine/adenosine deaminase-related metal-dependent hydrolase
VQVAFVRVDVTEGRIEAVRPASSSVAAELVLDEDELLAPGWVDLHNHLKMGVLDTEAFHRQGRETTTHRIARYDQLLSSAGRDAVARSELAAARSLLGQGTTTSWSRASSVARAMELGSAGPRFLMSRTIRRGPDLAARQAMADELNRAAGTGVVQWLPALALHEVDLPDTVLTDLGCAATQGPLPIQAHLAQRVEAARELGETDVQRLRRTGLLDGGRFVAVHGTYCTQEDLRELGRARVPLVYCACAARRAGVGNPVARLPRSHPVCLGTDTPPFHMGDELRTAVEDTPLSWTSAFLAATTSPAAAVGVPTGAIAPGLLADLVVWRVPATATGVDGLIEAIAHQRRCALSLVGGRVRQITPELQARALRTLPGVREDPENPRSR